MNADEIFLAAIEIKDPVKRAAYVKEACAGDDRLRAEVEDLLKSHEDAGSFLEGPVFDLDSTVDHQQMTEKPGVQIGPYKLLQQIGEGGMGVVYMAEQKEPVKRRVALKIIKPGMDSREVIARFEAERQALAMMDHPNIAKVLDAGQTESGRPYFVMELIKGVPLTQYCDEQHLTTSERLELFIPICLAVQHAHQKGIIHRDIKPSNTLVALFDGRPIPKVIDFGVAKATSQTLTEKTLFTKFGQIVGTVDYMSPEQAHVNQLDVDTRTDIYSLGVLLYELLTGNTPFDRKRLRSAAFDEMLRIIREEDPPKPSAMLSSSKSLIAIAANRHVDPQKLTSMVRGELDWIVMKALEKGRAERYPTANDFAEDVQRYLKNEAVTACPHSPWYRFSKFARRNSTTLSVVSAIAILLIVGITVSTYLAIRASNEASRANQQTQRANQQSQLAKQEASRAQKEIARQGLMSEAADVLYSDRRIAGWPQSARAILRNARDIRPADDIVDEYSLTLSGIDASRKQLIPVVSHRVAFSADDSRLLVSGEEETLLVDVESGKSKQCSTKSPIGAGPIGFSNAGIPRGVNCESPWEFAVHSLEGADERVQLKAESSDATSEESWGANEESIRRQHLSALEVLAQATPDLSRVVAWCGLPDTEHDYGIAGFKSGVVCVWNAASGELLASISVDQVSSLAITNDGSAVAVGSDRGMVQVYSTDGTLLRQIQSGLRRVTALAFGTSQLDSAFATQNQPWLVAAGDDSGSVAIHHSDGTPINTIRGTIHRIRALRFSPNGLMLLVAGHSTLQLWDAYSGHHLLEFPCAGKRDNVAFSYGGQFLAMPGIEVDSSVTQEVDALFKTSLWHLEYGRGVQTLRGMTSAGAKVVFSPDGRFLAALANDWTVYIWDVRSRSIVRQLRPPRGHDVGNSAMLFSPDGNTFWFAAGTAMTAFDLGTGEIAAVWRLPFGIQDRIAYDRDGRLLLCRAETASRTPGSYGESWEVEPRVCRLREMHSDGTHTVLKTLDEFERRIVSISASRSGTWFSVDGISEQPEDRQIAIFNSETNRIHFLPCVHTNTSVLNVIAEQPGWIMQLVQTGGDSVTRLYSLTTGSPVRDLPFLFQATDSSGQRGFLPGNRGRELFDIENGRKLFRVRTVPQISNYESAFSPDGALVAWASLDGTVSVCDIARVDKELQAIRGNP